MHHDNQSRRRFLVSAATAAMAIAGTQLSILKAAASPTPSTPTFSNMNLSLGPLKQIDAGLLNIGYAESGPANGPVVILLHGWPYDINSFAEVVPLLTAKGYRTIVPHLR
ncbi:MAG TPA: hypothetical protein VI233_15225, partial [Puia sp.]